MVFVIMNIHRGPYKKDPTYFLPVTFSKINR